MPSGFNAEHPSKEEGASVEQALLGPDFLQIHWQVCTFRSADLHKHITTAAAQVH